MSAGHMHGSGRNLVLLFHNHTQKLNCSMPHLICNCGAGPPLLTYDKVLGGGNGDRGNARHFRADRVLRHRYSYRSDRQRHPDCLRRSSLRHSPLALQRHHARRALADVFSKVQRGSARSIQQRFGPRCGSLRSILPEKCVYRNVTACRPAQLKSQRKRRTALARKDQRKMRSRAVAQKGDCGLALAVLFHPFEKWVFFHGHNLCHQQRYMSSQNFASSNWRPLTVG